MADGRMIGSAPSYAQINRKVWNTAQFRALSQDARELFFYLTTCPHGNMLGIFVLRPGYALDDLQWGSDRERFAKGLRELLAQGLFEHDPKNDIILDREQIEKHPPENHNQAKAALKIINSLPKTPLFQSLKLLVEQLNKPFLKPLAELLGERLAKPVTVTVTETVTEATKALPTGEQPVDNSKPEKIAPVKPEEKKPTPGNGRYESQEKFISDVQEVFREIEQAYPGGAERRQVQLFVERNLRTGHRGAIVHSLRSLVTAARQGVKIDNVGGYIGATFKIESAKYNARDHEAEAEVWKKPLPREAVGVLEKLGLKGFGGGA